MWESDAPGDAKDGHADYEELDKEACSDEEHDTEVVEDWVNEDGNLGPKDGKAQEDNGYNDHYAPF